LLNDTTSPDLAAAAEQAATIVMEAGTIALGFFRGDAQRWTKQDNSPVTEADLAVDRFLKERLPALVPGSAWLSEETVDTPERLTARLVWIVDPIDGTRSFIEGIPEWVISVALVADGRPIVAVIFNPSTDECFTACEGRGAFLNGERIAANTGTQLAGALVAGPNLLLQAFDPFGIRRSPWVHALANRFARVAAGRLDAAVARNDAYDWDIAAAHLLIVEAGGVLTDVAGRPPVYNRAVPRHGALLASGPGVFAPLLNAMQVAAEVAAQHPESPI
jgi:myo-inositol-1(or 4)-monophosphatase